MPGVVKQKPECRHCGTVLSHSLARCSRCGKRSWLNLILGGVGRLFGPVAGAMLYVFLEFALGGLTERWQLFLGLILLGVVLAVMVLIAPNGLAGLMSRFRAKFGEKSHAGA